MEARRSVPADLALIALIALLAWIPREVGHTRLRVPGQDRWVVTDSDSLYHMRRLERVVEEGLPVAVEDPYLNHPRGSAVPWPPYYTLALWAVLGPWLPEDGAERRAFIERGVATVPLVLGVLTAVLAALAARVLAGRGAALFAGAYLATSLASIAYSRAGNGDHHAWVTLLHAALLLAASAAFGRGALESAARGLRWGVGCGLLAGLLLGSWVASLLYVLGFQLVLGWLVIAHARRPLAGLGAFGASFHLAALAALLPAVLQSAWKDEHPWMVVNLSWFHVLHLALGALVFVPLLRGGPAPRARRAYPWVVAGSLGVLGVVLASVGAGPGAAIREGFAWVSRADAFMSTITESRPLVGAAVGGIEPLVQQLGYGVFLLPLAWPLALARALRRGGEPLLPWAVALPPLLLQALAQRRFAEAATLPIAVVLAWGLAQILRPGQAGLLAPLGKRLRSVPAWLSAAAMLLLALALQLPDVVLPSARALASAGERPLSERQVRDLGSRVMAEWLRGAPRETPPRGVLASWGHGHLIEWVADRPTVATNFGSYVGADGFVDSARFLLAEDPASAEAILEARRARYVFLTSEWPRFVTGVLRTTQPESWSRHVDAPFGHSGRLREAWFATTGARLMFGGAHFTPERGPTGPSLDFLRLLFASPVRDGAPILQGAMEDSPCGWIYEHVPGARLQAEAAPGTELAVEIPLRYGPMDYPLVFRASARAGPDGRVEVRVPYATDAANGTGRPAGAPTWRLGGRQGRLAIPERAVLRGTVVRLR